MNVIPEDCGTLEKDVEETGDRVVCSGENSEVLATLAARRLITPCSCVL